MVQFAPATSEKPYRILFEHRPRYLYVAIECETSNYAIARRYWSEILAMQTRRGYERVLIDKDVANSMALHDVVMLVSELAHSGCHDVKFAVYDRNYDAERCGIEEMAGTSRGLKVKICRGVDEAEQWLAASVAPSAMPPPNDYAARMAA